MSKNGRILVAMSGGIDSSIAAVMLHEQGYEVIGITMKTWDYASSGGSKKETGCCTLDAMNDARNVAVTFGFPHYILDLRAEFGNHIIDNFVEEYLAGRTPNPCVLCNTFIKWEALLKKADSLGCRFIATGHYARLRNENGRYIISKGKDASKDQSYVLWGVSQENLARTMFPLGNMAKSEVRKKALEYGFTDLLAKSESYEICFIPDNNYRTFLKNKSGKKITALEGGPMLLKNGTVVGTHHGYPYYTIGQRKGLEVALGQPMFVVDIIPETNTIVLGAEDELKKQTMQVSDYNISKYEKITGPLEVVTKIRYRDPGTGSSISAVNGTIQVVFNKPVKAVTSGQSAVFYEGDDVVGGGIIK